MNLPLQELARICAIFATMLVQSAYSQAEPAPPPSIAFTCVAVAVWDGDGPILCRDGGKVRLSGINAREMDGYCRVGHPCPAAGAIVARDALVQLLGGKSGVTRDGHITLRPVVLKCQVTGGSYGRITAFCRAPNVGDLSCALLASGTVAKWPRFWGQHRCR